MTPRRRFSDEGEVEMRAGTELLVFRLLPGLAYLIRSHSKLSAERYRVDPFLRYSHAGLIYLFR